MNFYHRMVSINGPWTTLQLRNKIHLNFDVKEIDVTNQHKLDLRISKYVSLNETSFNDAWKTGEAHPVDIEI